MSETPRPVRSGGPNLSVVVPAHNEESTIIRCLDGLVGSNQDHGDEIIVVTNGCTDRTAELVRSYGKGVQLLELAAASKREALEAGRQAARHPWHAYVDADIVVSLQALRVTVDEMLQAEAAVGAPTLSLNLDGTRWYAKSYARVWQALPWSTEEPVGSGVYVLAPAGLERLGSFPPITNDDQYVHDLFLPRERRRARGATFEMRPPRNWRGLVSRRSRVTAGRRELAEHFGDLPGAAPRESLLGMVRKNPGLIPHVPAVVAVALAAATDDRRRRRREDTGWARDDSSRAEPPS